MRQYLINEIFYSLQGEGVRVGTANIFLRFAGCNITCGFCDTEFESVGFKGSSEDLVREILKVNSTCKWIVCTGGEPLVQMDLDLIHRLKREGFKLSLETNGTFGIPVGFDWVCVSPKVAEHAVKPVSANEVKYVRRYGQGIPVPKVKADHYLISPEWKGGTLDRKDLEWCIQLCQDNPMWRLSVQQHPLWKVR